MRTWLVTVSLAAAAFASAILAAAAASATPPPPPRTATNCDARVYVIDDLVCSTPALLALDRQVAQAFATTPEAEPPNTPASSTPKPTGTGARASASRPPTGPPA